MSPTKKERKEEAEGEGAAAFARFFQNRKKAEDDTPSRTSTWLMCVLLSGLGGQVDPRDRGGGGGGGGGGATTARIVFCTLI